MTNPAIPLVQLAILLTVVGVGSTRYMGKKLTIYICVSVEAIKVVKLSLLLEVLVLLMPVSREEEISHMIQISG